MLDKHLWRVLLAILVMASLATCFATPSSPLCHNSDVFTDERARLRNMPSNSLLVNDTTYEELTCIGFNPTLNLLSATIEIKLPYGFNGSLCTPGSFEYVRFWVKYDGDPWQDVGVTSVNTHDIPDSVDCAEQPTKPLFYTVTLNFQPEQKFCGIPVLPRVRATLSWDQVPSLNIDPRWGNTLEEFIQSPALQSIPILPAVVYTGLDSNLSVDYMDTPLESHSDEWNKDQAVLNVPSHRDDASSSSSVFFEELTCLGLDWGYSSLVATVRIKRRRGYLASPCENNVFEYVSFWADWYDQCNADSESWTFLGTGKFNVHNFYAAPSTGLVYTVMMPVDVTNFSAPCNETKIVRVRAALAFNEIPPTPPAVAPRGNFIETHVHLQPFSGDTTIPLIRLIGNVAVQQIDTAIGPIDSPTSGMTLPGAMVVGYGFADPSFPHNRHCPFGGLIKISGEPFVGHSYRLMVRPHPPPTPGYVGFPVTNAIVVFNVITGVPHTVYPTTIEGYFKYQDQLQNWERILSFWRPPHGAWEIRLEMARLVSGNYVHEAYSPWYMVRVNQASPPPYARLDIFGTKCNDLTIGTQLTGSFAATSAFFDHWDFEVEPDGIPFSIGTVGNLDPLIPVDEPGKIWYLDTVGATACGYVIRLQSWDRTVVDSNTYDRYLRQIFTGFCLRKVLS